MAKDRTLLFSVTKKDLDFETFRSGGPGGQNQNKRETGVRVRHRASGAVGESREERSQDQNKQRAFKRMTETKEFQLWLRIERARRTGMLAEAEAAAERAMSPQNLRVEGRDERGRWVPLAD